MIHRITLDAAPCWHTTGSFMGEGKFQINMCGWGLVELLNSGPTARLDVHAYRS